jgi:hypothetical protein
VRKAALTVGKFAFSKGVVDAGFASEIVGVFASVS